MLLTYLSTELVRHPDEDTVTLGRDFATFAGRLQLNRQGGDAAI